MMPTVVQWRAVHGAHRTVLQLSSPTPYALATSLIGLEESMTSRHSSSLNSVLNDRRDLLMLVGLMSVDPYSKRVQCPNPWADQITTPATGLRGG
ncbi:hypothetical protein AWH04_11395 [Rhodococcus erythropolis]|nr:hypothetical protein AWH04_11395 [Rhodococcus erythropolis]